MTSIKRYALQKYLSTEEAASILCTNPQTLRQARVTGTLWGRPAPKFRKVGDRKVLYSFDEINEWVEAVEPQRIAGGAV